MMNLFGLNKESPSRGVRVTIEYCPKNITMPYKIKRLVNQTFLQVPCANSNNDPFGFSDEKRRVGEFLNEIQLEYLVNSTKYKKSDLEIIEIVESDPSLGSLLTE